MLIGRKARLEKTTGALERERASLVAHLETQKLTEDQLLGLQRFTAAVAKELNAMDDDFVTRWQVIKALDVQVTLAVEDGQKVAYTRCLFSDGVRLQFRNTCARIAPELTFGGRLMVGQGTLDPFIEVRILTPEPAGPLAQRQSGRLITGWSQVRILQGPLGT
jgi:hypothetical protein